MLSFSKEDKKITGIGYLKLKRRNVLIGIIALAIVSFIAGNLLDFEFLKIFREFPKAMSRFMKLYLPPNFSEIDTLIEGLWITFILSVSAGIVGSFLAYLAALCISRKTNGNKIVRTVFRFVATFIRNVPTSIWAIILLLSFWFGEFLAFLVMTLGTFGFNARVFSDTFDEANADTIEALDSVGANTTEIIAQAIMPETWPQILSWTLYAIETNIRESTVVGMLAGGGIGHTIEIFRSFRRFDELTAAVIFITILVLLFDKMSVFIREKLEV